MSQNDDEVSLKLNLLDNGIDFILKGIDEIYDETYDSESYYGALDVPPSGYKYGCLNLFSGFLLLLKERLARHLPELIYKGALSDVRAKLAKPNRDILNTVNLDEALERLEIGPKFVFSNKELKTIRSMQSFRNKAEHFELAGNKHELWSLVSKFLIIVDNFLAQELQISIESSVESAELFQKIKRIESVWKRLQEQRKKAWKNDISVQFNKFALLREKVLSELEEDDFMECPSCGDESLIVSGDYSGICTKPDCEGVFPIAQCDRCYQPVVGFDWESNLCEYCEGWLEKE